MSSPFTQEIPYRDPLLAFAPFVRRPYSVLLDSARQGTPLGRYSFIAADPFRTLTSKNGRGLIDHQETLADPFEILSRELRGMTLDSLPGFPPFQTGVAGYLGYDLCHHLERLPAPSVDDMQFPDLMLGFYDVVLAFDNDQRRAWAISSGLPEPPGPARAARARARAGQFIEILRAAPSRIPEVPVVGGLTAIESNFTRAAYEDAVSRVIDYILAGDVFQVNLSQRLCTDLAPGDSPFALYQRLRAITPAPFAAYLDFGEITLASASPERFLLLRSGWVESRPIKGTRPRGRDADQDRALADELLRSSKDAAENVMIVDLIRNDLSRVCAPGTVQVPALCALESHPTVHHLVSTVTGQLAPGQAAVELLRATLPGGSITGAPKVRAMEIIAELESTRRGPYCGCIGYIAFNGNMDLNIAIRTFTIRGDRVAFQVGGGIVAESDPAREYDETLVKAAALYRALGAPATLLEA
jgi:para-aminobenzoate synthetase component 1